MSETPQHAYISKVHLKGYKSIKDLGVDFKPGLNIIIGPNGSGKTNFLELVYDSLYSTYGFLSSSNASKLSNNTFDIDIYIQLPKEVQRNSIVGKFDETDNFPSFKIEKKYYLNNIYFSGETEKMSSSGKSDYSFDNITDKHSLYLLLSTKIDFGNYLDGMLKQLLTLTFIQKDKDKNKFAFYPSKETDIIGKCIAHDGLRDFSENKLIESLSIDSKVKIALERFTSIADLKVDDKKLSIRKENKLLFVDNFEFLFLINGKWLKWTQLSDGTKRLFLIITHAISESTSFLLEEPELGIHPDQLYLLMDFLKEQAKEKQIILTTHSPEVLNILDKNELDRIIVTRYDAENGTQMHHLSEKKIRKAVRYMSTEGLSIKDFWVHSNLEELDEED